MTSPTSWTSLLRRLLILFTFLSSTHGISGGELRHVSLASPAMGQETWGFQVYLPPSYFASEDRYPVIYILHGGGSDEYSMGFVASQFYEPLLPQLPEAILVFPNGGRDTFYLDDGVIRRQRENPDRHLIKELIPFIDSHFRSIPSREARSIMGFSMGAYGAYHFGFKYPELFGAVGALAAGGPYGPQGLITQYSAAEKPQSLAVTQRNQLKDQTTIFIAVGGQDLVDYNNEMAGILRAQGLDFSYQVLPGAGHDLGALLRSYAQPLFRSLLKQPNF